MNRQVSHIGIASLVLLAALIVGTTYWQTWANAGLADRQDNAIRTVAQFTIKRGKIYAADGKTLLARNVAKQVDGQTLYFRRYPAGPLFADIVGYSTQSHNRTGLEESYNDYLTGSNANLDTVFRSALDKLRGTTISGNDLVLTVRPGVQALALRALRGKCGAVVALEPSTGRVLAMATNPTYNPNLVEHHFAQATKTNAPCGAPLFNRATQGLFVPGSSFKVVTASAALDTGRFTPQSTFEDPGYCLEYGKQVHNFADQSGPEVFGTVSFPTALEHSINAVFCNIGKSIGAFTILDYMKRYGFYSVPPLETPLNERQASGLYKKGKLFYPKRAYQVDVGRLAFGQAVPDLFATPLQMAMVAGAIGNHGAMMRPQLIERVVSPGGKTITHLRPDRLGRPIKQGTAAELTSMMELVVSGGTGTAAQISGIRVAGKTGTAEQAGTRLNTTWFIAFAPADAPRVAVAVVLEKQAGSGGSVAAPIAKQVMEALLR